MKTKLLLLLSILSLCVVNAQNTYVPDDNFEQALIDLGYDDTLDDYVVTANINTVNNLQIPNKSISSLEGIEDFTELQHLNASQNNLTDLQIGNLEFLITLNVSNNNLSSLSIFATNIQVFNTSNNPNLSCIQVNDIISTNYFAYDGNPDFSIDDQSSFSENCADRVYVPDDNFEQSLIDLGYDDILDDYINKSDVEDVSSLDVSNKQIDVLTGIEAFTRLQVLNVSDNSLDELPISDNVNLTELNCNENSLDALNVSANTLLQKLFITFNYIRQIDLSNNTALIEFQASTNRFTNIDFSNNINLQILGLSYNDITSLDITKNTALKEVYLFYNQISTIDLSQNVALERINLQDNNITNIDISQNVNLLRFSIADTDNDGNNITSIDASNNLQLERLTLSGNVGLANLDISMLENLQFFYATDTALSCISVFDVDYATTFWTEYVEDNVVFANNCNDRVYVPDDLLEQKFIDLGYDDVLDDYIFRSDVENVTTLQIENINIDDLTGLEAFASLEVLILTNLSFDNIDLSPFSNLRILSLFRNLLQNIDVTNNSALEEVNLTENNLSTLDLSLNPNLQNLSINYNEFTSIDLSNNTQLKYFNALGNSQGNQITSIDFSNNTLLEEVQLEGNLLTSIDISNNTNLKRLFVPSNNISDIDVSNNLLLERLSVTNNNLSSLDLSMLENLAFLYSSGNNLNCVSVFDVDYANQQFVQFADDTTIFTTNCEDRVYVPDDNFEQALIDLGYDDVLDDYIFKSDVEDVTSLDISNKQIDILTGIEAFTILQILNVNNNSLDELDITQNTMLTEVNCGNNSLDVLDISNNTQLVTLNIIFNSIDEIDISNNTLLEYFFASHNFLSTLNTTSNTALKEIGLSYNDVENLDLSTNINLVKLDLLNNSGAFNDFSEIDLTQNILLEEVNLQGNSLTQIDLSQNPLITRLYIADNDLENIDFSNNSAISWLGLARNNLTSLDLRSITDILSFNATDNPLLKCVSVNDVAFANERWTGSVDEGVIFSSNCSDFVYIPDDNFEQRLIDLELDDVLDNFVLRANIEDIEDLNLSTRMDNPDKVQNLTGIEAFTSLNSLSISFNNIANVDLSQNLTLEFFFAQFCNISSLTLPNSQSLRLLDVHTNNISSLDLSNYINLTSLQIDVNNFTTLDVSQNTNLNILSISNNNLGTLDISNNIALTNLRAEFIGLSTLDVSVNTNLINLNVQRNDLVTLDVSTLRQLAILDCSRNDLSTLDISNNIRLETFDAIVNPNLRCIKVWDVDYANENWSDNIDSTASFGESCYTEIPDTEFEKALIDFKIDDVVDGLVLTDNVKSIKSLTLISRNISDLTGIEAFTELNNLSVKGNNLTSIDLSQNTALINLNIIDNQIDRLNISNNISLVDLEAKENPDLTCIQVWDVTYAENNWSNKIDATASFSEDCDDVWTVEVDKGVKDILKIINGVDKDNDGEITLKEAKEFSGDLDLSNKNIKNIEGLQAFENIKSLNLSGNVLKDLSTLTGKKITLVSKNTGKRKQVFAKASKLETLIISGNRFETLNLEELKDLKIIDISNNPNLGTISIKNGNNMSITNFDSTNCPNLTCILVDDKNASSLNNWAKDTVSNFVADLADCRSAVLTTQKFLQKDVKVYPNPVTNFLTLESSKEFDTIEIYNAIGKRIIKTKERKIDFSNYTSGIYFLKIIAENHVLTKRVMKK